MKRTHLTFQLTDGFVDDWLVLGPHDQPLDARPAPAESQLAFRSRVLSGLDHKRSDFQSPMEIDRETFGEQNLYWQIEHCEADHLLDWSGSGASYSHRRAWAFALLSAPLAEKAKLRVTTTCPTTLWLDDKLIGRCEHLTALNDQTPRAYTFEVDLKAHDNRLLIRLDQIVSGDAAMAFALRVKSDSGKPVKVQIPTVTQDIKQRVAMQRAFHYAYLDRAVCTRDDTIHVIGDDDTPGRFQAVMRVQTPDGWIYGESYGSIGAGTNIEGVPAVQLPSRPMQALLLPPHQLFYEGQMRAQRALDFLVANRPFDPAPTAPYEERMVEAMQQASRGDDIYAELANMAAGWWESVNPKTITTAIHRVVARQIDCLPDLLALISMRERMAQNEHFPADLAVMIDEAITGFDYGTAADGPAVVAAYTRATLAEPKQILLYASHILAGQLFPKAKFAASGLTGRQERNRGEKLALGWMRERAQRGFGIWNAGADPIIAALAHLADLAENDQVADLSAVLLDKTLFGIAIHSLRGAFGGSRGQAEPAALRTGRLAAESGIGRLLWGMGAYESGLAAVVSLALASENYQLPAVIQAIATDSETELWARERHSSTASTASTTTSTSEVNIATYRAADFMLSSAQDYQPGERGGKEHIWQATLAPEALVFTNHPTSFSQSACREAGWWRGNGSLPRVAQWKDALIALYDLPSDAWLRFTHAYFPLYAFSEHIIEEGWAFARAEDVYIALYTSQPFELIRRGPDAHRELRAPGLRNVWLCQMGARDTDTSLESFRRRVIASQPKVDDLHVRWDTIRGDRLEFDWASPLLLNGQEQPLTGFKHHESIYGIAEFPAQTMDIVYGQDVLRLNFG